MLHLAESLTLPLDVVTEKLAWLGRTGSGKTYGAMKLAELMLEAGAQIGALDPVGVWRGLRVPARKGGRSISQRPQEINKKALNMSRDAVRVSDDGAAGTQGGQGVGRGSRAWPRTSSRRCRSSRSAKVLNGLAFLHGIGVAPADKTQLALLVGVSPTSGGYFNNLGSLRSDGLIDYPSGGTVALTAVGQALASTDGVPSTTDELHDAIRAKLPPAKWKILEALIKVYPNAVAKDALAEQLGVSPTSGGYFNNLGSLRSLGLIDYPSPGAVAALPVLFLES